MKNGKISELEKRIQILEETIKSAFYTTKKTEEINYADGLAVIVNEAIQTAFPQTEYEKCVTEYAIREVESSLDKLEL